MRYPIAPLLQATGMTFDGLRRMAAMSGRTYQKAVTVGLTEGQADRYSVRCGLHPANVWPEWLDGGLVDPVTCPVCATMFDPTGDGGTPRRYCSTPCRDRARWLRQSVTRRGTRRAA